MEGTCHMEAQNLLLPPFNEGEQILCLMTLPPPCVPSQPYSLPAFQICHVWGFSNFISFALYTALPATVLAGEMVLSRDAEKHGSIWQNDILKVCSSCVLPVFHRLSFPDDWEKTVASNNVLSIAHALNNLINNIIIFDGSRYILLSSEKITIP